MSEKFITRLEIQSENVIKFTIAISHTGVILIKLK